MWQATFPSFSELSGFKETKEVSLNAAKTAQAWQEQKNCWPILIFTFGFKGLKEKKYARSQIWLKDAKS